jgi:hypothetical protein
VSKVLALLGTGALRGIEVDTVDTASMACELHSTPNFPNNATPPVTVSAEVGLQTDLPNKATSAGFVN